MSPYGINSSLPVDYPEMVLKTFTKPTYTLFHLSIVFYCAVPRDGPVGQGS